MRATVGRVSTPPPHRLQVAGRANVPPFHVMDLLVRELRREFPAVWFVGCGAAIVMLAGEVSRAPWWMQRFGLEWAYRLVMEPRRLFRRYIIEDIPFVLKLISRRRLKSPT